VQLYRNGGDAGLSNKPESRFFIEQPGAYRVVVFQERAQWPWFSRRRMAWIFSNPIQVKRREAAH
jgi:ABC-type taurine transport system ATPase subunit